jgi:hypothetical protein
MATPETYTNGVNARLLKAGARLKSAVCDTQIMVLRIPPEPLDLRCGGHPMLLMADPEPGGAAMDPTFEGPTLTGKRYTNDGETMEFLCTKGGAGALSVNGAALVVKQAKQLPSSD